jgi:hypothetical protein
MVALARAPWKVRHAARGYQQFAGYTVSFTDDEFFGRSALDGLSIEATFADMPAGQGLLAESLAALAAIAEGSAGERTGRGQVLHSHSPAVVEELGAVI